MLQAVSILEGHPSWGGQGARLAQELAPNPTGISSGAPRSMVSPRERSFNITPPPQPTLHWYTYTFTVYRYTQRAAVRMGATKPAQQHPGPRGSGGAYPHSALGLGEGRDYGPPGADIAFTKPLRASAGEQEPSLI